VVEKGMLLGSVSTVLKKYKRRLMTMLHFEKYEHWIKETAIWKLGKEMLQGLTDPTTCLKFWETNMINLHDILTAQISGIAEYKNEKEIWWKNDVGSPITVEIINTSTEEYKIRRYYKNGTKHWERDYVKGQLHGKHIEWYKNGTKSQETDYVKGQSHGKHIEWYENGNKSWEVDYVKGQKHGKNIGWYKNGTKSWEVDYVKGQLHGKNIGWYKNGTKSWEVDYVKGQLHGKHIEW